MRLNLRCDNPDEFVKNEHGNLIQKKFLVESPKASSDWGTLKRLEEIISNRSLMQLLINKANQSGISVQECVMNAIEEYLR